MNNALVFPGQGAQFVGMGKDLYEQNDAAKALYEQANDILGFRITDTMFDGTDDALKDTKITQPALYIHSVIRFLSVDDNLEFGAVAGHSLGEFSALVAAGVLSFEDGLRLVKTRAEAMQAACEQVRGTMAAILGLEDDVVEKCCADIDEVVVPANFNCPGQLVISGSETGIDTAIEKLTELGARKAIKLVVGGAFHSPLMQPAKDNLAQAIADTHFNEAKVPVYQNVDAKPYTSPAKIKDNLINQLTSPVRWTQIMKSMTDDGYTEFMEIGGNGKVLKGLFRRFDRAIKCEPLI